ncbi:MAG TPA: DHA2 family efflux MFS transporter permease subunit, partial [Gaiellaceae bacterium]
MTSRQRTVWTFVITTVALFMVVLDNLVVSTALPVIRVDLGASIEELEWTVNAYTLTFAAFLLTGAALGDRFGRKRLFMIGIGIFTAASAAAALAPSADWLIAARAVQGIGGAIVTPLTLTLLSAAVPAARRGAALGVWSGVAGLAVASGPLVGGAVVEGLSWQWIFWINVPLGLVLLPLATRLTESYGPDRALDLPGLGFASVGLLGLVWGLVNGNGHGWWSPEIVAAIAVGVGLLAAFVAWERRVQEPMLPMRFFRNRAFSAANAASLLMYFGMFGSIFLLTQFFQTAQGYSPLEAGLRILPWTAMPMIVAPIAGALSDRIGGRPLMATGLALQAIGLAWIASVSTATIGYASLVGPFVLSGIGMAMFFAPVANVVLSAVRRVEEGKASGANNAIREVGGVLGVAVLASIFVRAGGY